MRSHEIQFQEPQFRQKYDGKKKTSDLGPNEKTLLFGRDLGQKTKIQLILAAAKKNKFLSFLGYQGTRGARGGDTNVTNSLVVGVVAVVVGGYKVGSADGL